jgi:hypothetical protein
LAALTLAADGRGEAALVGGLVSSLLGHAEEFGDLKEADLLRLRHPEY